MFFDNNKKTYKKIIELLFENIEDIIGINDVLQEVIQQTQAKKRLEQQDDRLFSDIIDYVCKNYLCKGVSPGEIANLSNQTTPMYGYIKNKIHKMNNADLYVIIVFIILFISYGLYTLKKQKTKENPPLLKREYRPPKNHLVLILNARKQNGMLQKLQEKEKELSRLRELADDDQLFHAAEWIWLGTREEFDRDFSALFSSESSPNTDSGEKDEYDVRLVYIELKEEDARLLPEAKLHERMQAFRALKDKARSVRISSVLNFDGIKNHTKFYKNL